MKAFSPQVRYTLIVLAMALASLLGILAGLAALLGGATITDRPPLFLLAGLAGLDAPALVIKGSCDYLSWSSAQEYLRVLPHARLGYLDGAGHNSYQDEPEGYMEEVLAFLLGRRPLEAPYEINNPPDDYEGPH